MDFLDDLLSEPSTVKAPAANRFKPKAKPKPQKGPSVTAKATNEQPVESSAKDSASDEVFQPNDIVDKQLDVPIGSSLTNNETAGTKETTTFENQHLDGNLTVDDKEVMDSSGAQYSETVVSKSSEVEHLSIDASLRVQSSENNIVQSTYAANLPLDMPTLNASGAQNADKISSLPEIAFSSASPFRPCTQTADLSMPSTYQDSGYYREATVTSDAGELWISIEEGAEGFSCLEDGDIMGETPTASGQRPVKFQPKPKTQIGRKKDAPQLSSENQQADGDGSIYAEEPTASGLLNAKLDGGFPSNPTTTQPGSVVYEDADSWMAQNLPEQCGEQGKGMPSDALNCSDRSLDGGTGSLGSDATEDGYEINDGATRVRDNSNAEACDQAATSGGENYLGNEKSKKKRSRKSKKPTSENDESGKKKCKIDKVPDQSTAVPPKKVPRAPRRKRIVNKALLEAAEDELDLQKVPIRDLIILADYKERQAKKDAAAVQPSLVNERTDNTLSEEPLYDDYGNPLDYDQDGDSYDNPSTSAALKDTSYLNYHSYMDKSKTTKVRWSKEETELFYQGIREFGSDFLMIQKLHFPGRTRHQIKLKYKKEERENPDTLHAALNGRAKDLSHFEILAQRLQKEAAAEKEAENQMSDEDNPTSPAGDEDNPTGPAKPDEESAAADEVLNTAQNGSPAKSYDDEDDFNWDDYKSGL